MILVNKEANRLRMTLAPRTLLTQCVLRASACPSVTLNLTLGRVTQPLRPGDCPAADLDEANETYTKEPTSLKHRNTLSVRNYCAGSSATVTMRASARSPHLCKWPRPGLEGSQQRPASPQAPCHLLHHKACHPHV